jgi:hypothetical protein
MDNSLIVSSILKEKGQRGNPLLNTISIFNSYDRKCYVEFEDSFKNWTDSVIGSRFMCLNHSTFSPEIIKKKRTVTFFYI